MIKRVQARQRGISGYIAIHRPIKFGNPYSVSTFGRDMAHEMYRKTIIGPKIADGSFLDWVSPIIENGKIGCLC